MTKTELRKLQEFLRQSFAAPALKVGLDPKNTEEAVVTFGERALGRIREYGLAVEDRRGVLTYAAPVSRLGQDGTAAALSITWYAKPQTARRVEHEFRRSVAAISRDLGASISA